MCPDREERVRECQFTVPIHAEFGILWGVYKTVLKHECTTYVRMYGIVINSERPYFDSTWKNTTRLSIRLFHIMTAFRREPCELLTINAIIVKQHRFYPNIKIIRLKRHYLPLGLLLVLYERGCYYVLWCCVVSK